MNTLSLLPVPSDLLFRPKLAGVVQHAGVYLGGGRVIENTPETGERLASLSEFAAGNPVRMERASQPLTAVLARAQRVLTVPKPWDAVSRNCEHTAYEVATGEARSPQLALILVLLALAGIILVANRD